MFSIKSTFTAAASDTGFDIFWMLVLAIAILDDEQHREQKRRDKRERFAKAAAKLPKPKPPGL